MRNETHKVEAAGMNSMDRTIADGGLKEMMPASFPLVVMTVTAPPRRRGPCYE